MMNAVETASGLEYRSAGNGSSDEPAPFIHMHIPKTAGTSLRRTFEAEFNADNIFLFNYDTARLLRSDRRQLVVPNRYIGAYERLRGVANGLGLNAVISSYFQRKRIAEAHQIGHDLSQLPDLDFKVVSGHLDGDTIQASGLTYPVVTVVREPLERTVSFFRHWQRSNGQMFSAFFGEHSKTAAFEDVALNPPLHNFQSRWIGDVALARIGVVDRLAEFLNSIGLPQPDGRVLIANQDPSGQATPDFDEGFLRTFVECNAEDYELYQRTCDSWA